MTSKKDFLFFANKLKNQLTYLKIGSRNSAWIECFPSKEEVAGSNPAESVGFITNPINKLPRRDSQAVRQAAATR
tara:strand:+ start:688 stop:912 length:225 start_codon:yes stop_codon:yes gene_type:complete